MGHLKPNLKKRSYLLPHGCKNLADLLPLGLAMNLSAVNVRVNGRIKAPSVNVIGCDGRPLGILPLVEALHLAVAESVDLVEIDRHAQPPTCRLVDFGKFRYEQARRRSAKK